MTRMWQPGSSTYRHGRQEPAFGEIVRQLAATASKSNSGVPAYTRWVNRPLGRRIAAAAFLYGITPNQLTSLNAAIIFPVLVLIPILKADLTWTLSAGLLLLIGYAFDSADGQLARLTGGGTKVGEWLDHVVDSIKAALFHAVLTVFWFRFYSFTSYAWLMVPLCFGVVASTYFFAQMLADHLRFLSKVQHPSSYQRPTVREGRYLRSFALLPMDWGTFCIIVFLLPFQWIFVVVYTSLFVVNTVFVVIGIARWYRELRALG